MRNLPGCLRILAVATAVVLISFAEGCKGIDTVTGPRTATPVESTPPPTATLVPAASSTRTPLSPTPPPTTTPVAPTPVRPAPSPTATPAPPTQPPTATRIPVTPPPTSTPRPRTPSVTPTPGPATPTPGPGIVAGDWTGTYDPPPTECDLHYPGHATFAQDGSIVTGTLTAEGGYCGLDVAFQGTLQAGLLRGTVTRGGFSKGTVRGVLTGTGLEIVITRTNNCFFCESRLHLHR